MQGKRNIAVDLRSLHTSDFSGVESYTVRVLEQLLETDRDTVYKLFYNGFSQKQFDYFHFINAQYIQTRIPNRILNVSLKLFSYPKLEKLTGPQDILFLPNWNTIAVEKNTKVVLTVHDLSPLVLPEYYSLKSRIWHWMINIPKLIKRADTIVAVSDFTKTSLIEKLQVPANKIIVAPLGVDHDNFKPNLPIDALRDVRNRYNLPGDFVLFIGTVEPRKNIARLVAAFEKIESPLHLVIAGKLGWKYAAILQQIENSPKRRFIKLIGYVPESDKPHLLKLARVFAWPSLYEGFGLPILEAMAIGTPVLTSHVSSLPEVASDSALLVNPYNIDDIAQGITILHSDAIIRQKYIAKGITRSQEFSWEKCAAIIKTALQ